MRAGTDPIERRRAIAATALAPAQRTTFKQAAERYYAAKGGSWSKKHAIQFPNTMRDYVYPVLGDDLPVADMDLDRVHRVLEPIWTTKPETASRVRARMEQVLDWATTLKMRHGDNPARWRGNLSNLLPERKKVRKVTHHPALPYDKMQAFWSALETRQSASAEGVALLILTAARTSEVTGARWREFDLDKNVWTVPEDRMKARRAHRVPLSDAALCRAGARMMHLKTGDDGFVLPGAKQGEPLSGDGDGDVAAKDEPVEGPSPWVDSDGKQVVPHGFRSTFRDWAAELTAHPNEMVEMALAHTVGNKVEAAYRRGDMFERRRRLMADWASWCTTASVPNADNVRRIGQKAVSAPGIGPSTIIDQRYASRMAARAVQLLRDGGVLRHQLTGNAGLYHIARGAISSRLARHAHCAGTQEAQTFMRLATMKAGCCQASQRPYQKEILCR